MAAATRGGIPLITQDDETGKYEVSSEALELLATIEAPIAIVAIAGLWRTGKSYLLNHLSGANAKKTGFAVGATVNACTKGLWLWGEPVKLPDGLNVLFVDTEGLGSTSRTQTEDSQIFSLALLLSSLFVWNSRGVIDGNALEDFALVVNLTKHIHVRSNAANKTIAAAASTTDEKKKKKKQGGFVAHSSGSAHSSSATHELESLAEHFPSFLWVVRDFTLRLEDGGRKINDRQYLENALKPQQSFTSEAASRNQIRTLLSSFFRERDCVTLVRPAEDEAVLRDLSRVHFTELRPEFQVALERLKSKVFASIRAKQVKGRALSGAMLGTLAETYAEALNSGTVPTISTAWDRVLQSQAAEAAGKALAVYDGEAAKILGLKANFLEAKSAPQADDDDAIRELCDQIAPVDAATLAGHHEAFATMAEAVYLKAVWADDTQQADSSSRALSMTLDTHLTSRLRRLSELNKLVSYRFCASLFTDLIANLAESLELVKEDNDLAFAAGWLEAYVTGSRKLLAEYDKAGVGPAKWMVVMENAEELVVLAQGWATKLGVEHRKIQKSQRSLLAELTEAQQAISGKLSASRVAATRELEALERAGSDAEKQSAYEVQHLDAMLEARTAEIEQHKTSQLRLQRAYDFSTDLLEKQSRAQTELAEDLKSSLASLRSNGPPADAEEDEYDDWDIADLGFEKDELADFATMTGVDLKSRVADDEKELELMHEHAALTIEHAKVKKMLLADKDHELQEYEYQWGVAKANVAASEGELMVIEEEVSVLKGLVVQLNRYHAAHGSRGSSKITAELARALPRDQRAILEGLQAETTHRGSIPGLGDASPR